MEAADRRPRGGRLGLPFSRDRLTSDPDYNARLGQAYLSELLEQFDGSYILALAAYNAGPSRAQHAIHMMAFQMKEPHATRHLSPREEEPALTRDLGWSPQRVAHASRNQTMRYAPVSCESAAFPRGASGEGPNLLQLAVCDRDTSLRWIMQH